MTMFRRRLLIWLALCGLLTSSAWAEADGYRLGFFTTRSEGDPYWAQVLATAEAAADDLGIALEPFYAEGDHFRLIRQVQAALEATPRFDALIVPNFKATAHRNIKAADAAGVPILLFNSDLSDERRAEIGLPRERYRNWIGRILPDEERAGALMMETLLALDAQINPASHAVSAVAIGGNLADFSSIMRTRGMERALANHPRVTLHQLVHADWEGEKARSKALLLLQRYPRTRIIWTASDVMALGAAQVAAAGNEALLLGGFDWTEAGLKAVEAGELAVSMGGHILNGGWAVVLAYDFLRGVIPPEEHTWLTPMQPLTSTEAEEIKRLLRRPDWGQVDFSTYSRAVKPDQPAPHFDPLVLIKNLPIEH